MVMEVPKTMKAVVVVETDRLASTGGFKTMVRKAGEKARDIVVKEVPVPELGPGMYRVKAVAVGLNPTDWKTCDFPAAIQYRTGAIAGCDFSGIIADIGPETRGRFKIGDRVAGWIQGTSALCPQYGAFCEWVAADEHAMWKLPDDITYERAASSGVAISTAGLSLWWHNALDLPFPGEGPKVGDYIFIYGGSTSVSQIAIQFAKLIGLRVITAAGVKNHEALKRLGADVTIDYRDPGACIKAVRSVTDGKLRWGHDGISDGESIRIVHSSMGDEPGKIVHVTPEELYPKDAPKVPHIEDKFVLSYYALGREVEFWGNLTPRDETLVETLRKSMEFAEQQFSAGTMKLQEVEVLPNGLAGVRDGYERARTVGLGPRKLVWRVAETPI